MRRDDPRLEIIREAIERLIPRATPAYMTVTVTETLPGTTGHDGQPSKHTWTGRPHALAEEIFTALFGRSRDRAEASPRVTLSRTEALKAITRVLKQPVDDVAAADLIYGRALAHIKDPQEAAKPWAMQVDVLALRIARALPLTDDSGQRSPLAQAEDAKRRRDLTGELGVLMSAGQALESAPWYPCRPGDLVHVHYEAVGDVPLVPAFGETYVIGDAGDGLLSMKFLAHSLPEGTEYAEGMVGCFAAEAADCPVYELWFEAGPHRLTIVRDGRVVHNGGAR
ncbi:hypothetical protein [Streptomyces ipomoeae]|uniref:hypothetical protein n=1 Tax=Streptomyces ipomoeae TaxID=103232 RepID=UPI0029AF9F93|nr:hypothetical protein [Streptomyces ipomoeae]MDX2700341.1 hypothetical protein [Streptomyces ipomoeae]MDX2845965.1 hypothetical protein [Streptomyces ipomoeae]